MDLIKHFWYLIYVERQKETVTTKLRTSQRTPLKTILQQRLLQLFSDSLATTLASAIFRQFGNNNMLGKKAALRG
jgi:hypothetical protein